MELVKRTEWEIFTRLDEKVLKYMQVHKLKIQFKYLNI
jgi:hypothetical protein